MICISQAPKWIDLIDKLTDFVSNSYVGSLIIKSLLDTPRTLLKLEEFTLSIDHSPRLLCSEIINFVKVPEFNSCINF